MLRNSQAALAIVAGTVRVGSLHLSLYGFFAAAGLIGALSLSQRTAHFAALDPHRLWDAGVFAVVAAWLSSRLLLILGNLRAFRAYPLLLLALPSFTAAGMVLTAAAVLAYLWHRHFDLLAVLDAWAVPACLLAATLALGHFAEGTRPGMPTQLPWGVPTRVAGLPMRVHPVQLYDAVAAGALGLILFWRLQRPHRAGDVGALALLAGGALLFLLEMWRTPALGQAPRWLGTGQASDLVLMWLGTCLWAFAAPRTSTRVQEVL